MNKPYVLGIDIGGTNTVFGLVDARGTVIVSGAIKTAQHPVFQDYIDELYSEASKMIKSVGAEDKVGGIGVGAPNANFYTGTIDNAANLIWSGSLPLAESLRTKFGIPVAVTNDANAAAIGEMTYGAARGMKDFIMITLGTGVGSGIVANGQMIYGADGLAGELGHVISRRGGRPCGCGRNGCLETYCSATGVVRSALEFLDASPSVPSLLRNIPSGDLTSKDVYDAAVAGDPIAQSVFEFTGRVLGEALADFATFSSPEAFIIFGGLAKAGEMLFKPMREAYRANCLKFQRDIKILPSELKEADAAVLGASALGWEAQRLQNEADKTAGVSLNG
ncbi:MAG: ROK family protein [Bacteroides sp.]|nr:ROK family protein [Bacteroides sp.]MBD5342847.1 ROK family protein [Bacteroides sp.]MBD5352568.1 ROK family protein [Bacteroides sp.]MBD5359628.1 ROK family protein [Bacteroides sp.]MBD5361821.1 ROK family protein [Bacteroides sp.]